MRLTASKRRAARIARMRRHAPLRREAQGLWTTGAAPQGSYGHRAHGMSPSNVLAVRRQAA
eukprot:7658902-Pyramimonas_sp.AAC.1